MATPGLSFLSPGDAVLVQGRFGALHSHRPAASGLSGAGRRNTCDCVFTPSEMPPQGRRRCSKRSFKLWLPWYSSPAFILSSSRSTIRKTGGCWLTSWRRSGEGEDSPDCISRRYQLARDCMEAWIPHRRAVWCVGSPGRDELRKAPLSALFGDAN
jgi:hypothetical protein